MTRILIALFFTVLSTFTLLAENKASLAERLLILNTDVTYDEVYNKALDEMQNLDEAGKAKLSKELALVLAKDKVTDRRANAAMALGDLCATVKTNDAVLASAFADKEKVVRQAVNSGITRCGATPITIKILKAMLNDKEATIRAMAEANMEKLNIKK